MSGLRILVCGGRTFGNRELMKRVLDAHFPFDLVIHGGAPGADCLAGQWARNAFVPVRVFRADWSKHGKAAGPIRNETMLRVGRPDLVIAFPGGRGTADMVHRAKLAGVKVTQVKAEP